MTQACWRGLTTLARDVACEEIGIVTVPPRLEDRFDSYRLLAGAQGDCL